MANRNRDDMRTILPGTWARWRWLALTIIWVLAPPAHGLLPAREAGGFVSIVLDEGTEIGLRNPPQITLLPWTSELRARVAETEISEAWEQFVGRIREDWSASTAGCWFCAPGGWPVLNLACIEAARQAVSVRLGSLYTPVYWTAVETSLHRLPTLWAQSPRPGEGAVIACVAGESSPPYASLLPDPYYHQIPRPPYPPHQESAELPGDPAKEAMKEILLGGRPARIEGYQHIGYVVFFRTRGETVAQTVTAVVRGVCVQCLLLWCWPVVMTWPVPLQLALPKAKTDWPAVAEGYGIPDLR